MKQVSYPATVLTKQTNSQKPIYLDNQSTTSVDPRVVQVMLPYFTEEFGNPHSDAHIYGWETDNILERNRGFVADIIGADAREIVFTSGATESCNLVIRGITRKKVRRKKIVTVATEHPCVLETCKSLANEDFDIFILPVQNDGLIDLNHLAETIDDQTLLVSIMLANNEIGVLQPLQEITKICHRVGAYLHTDATQAVGKIPINVRELDIDFLSFSAHKYYGPKGIGGLYIRWGLASTLEPLMTGGGQEKGLRPGTVAVPLVAGFGETSRIAHCELENNMIHTGNLTHELYSILKGGLPEIKLYGHPQKRLPGNLNVGFLDISGEEIIERVSDQIAISTGSACSSVESKPSHVLEALGLTPEEADSGIRISIGRFNTIDEIKKAGEILVEAARL